MRTLLVLSFFALLVLSCATSQVKEKSFELRFKKIDHFMIDKYEVGALEYDFYLLPSGFIQRYHFPIYVQGDL